MTDKKFGRPHSRKLLLTLALGTFLTVADDQAPGESVDASAPRQRRVLYNFDGDSCMFTKAGGKGPVAIDVDDLKKLIEEVAYEGSRVDTVLVCVNAQVMYYPTKVGTMRGALSTPDQKQQWPPGEKQRSENLKRFFDAGIDPYAVMLAETKRRNRETLLSFRVNDAHGNDFLRTQFWVDHPECRSGASRGPSTSAATSRATMSRLIEEAMQRYDCDGLELDFNRFPTLFKDGTTDERVAKINSFVERVRKTLDEIGQKRGRRLVLACASRRTTAARRRLPQRLAKSAAMLPHGRKAAWSTLSPFRSFCSLVTTCRSDRGKRRFRLSPSTAASSAPKGDRRNNTSRPRSIGWPPKICGTTARTAFTCSTSSRRVKGAPRLMNRRSRFSAIWQLPKNDFIRQISMADGLSRVLSSKSTLHELLIRR